MQPGIAYSVAYKGRVLKAGGFGVKTKGSNDAPDSSTIFRVGSVSKVFPVGQLIFTRCFNHQFCCMQVLAMFQMFGRGQITSLDDPLAKYCTGFSMMTEYNITLRQMAAQVSISDCVLMYV